MCNVYGWRSGHLKVGGIPLTGFIEEAYFLILFLVQNGQKIFFFLNRSIKSKNRRNKIEHFGTIQSIKQLIRTIEFPLNLLLFKI